MASQSCKDTCRRSAARMPANDRNESGAVLILATFALVGLLAFVGLAVDSGNLYCARLKLQAAADSGALGGIAATVLQNERLRGQPFADVRAFVEARARQITNENLRQTGIAVDPANEITAELTTKPLPGAPPDAPEVLTLEVSASAEVDFLLIHIVPFDIFGVGGTGRSLRLSAAAANAIAERRPGNVSLILDVSRSMACPADGECTCNTPERTRSCEEETAAAGVDSRLDLLKEAVSTFLDQFDTSIDRVSLTPFNIAASLDDNYVAGGQAVRFSLDSSVNSPQAEFGFDLADFESAMDNFSPTGATNICDGIMRAYSEASRVGLAGNPDVSRDQEVSYVVFSDGAPTAGRFLFANPNQLPPTGVHNGASVFDYISYSVHWSDTESGEEHRWFGPSPLAASSDIEIGYNQPAPPPGSVPACSDEDGVPNPGSVSDVFGPACLQNMGAFVPIAGEMEYGSEYGSDRPYIRWREQYYNCALQAADWLRRNKGTVFVIGLGDPSTETDDPYQGIEDTLSRKDIFLTRLANDYTTAYRLPEMLGISSFPEFDYSGYSTYTELQDTAYRREGIYLATADADALKQLFKKIALRIQLRLID